MKAIDVGTSASYQVLIDCGLIRSSGVYIRKLIKPGKAAVISDSNVFPLYGKTVIDSLNNAGFEVYSFCFQAGEAQKNSTTYLQILNFLAENSFTRSDTLIALGGGVVGDMTGFAAATYLRGIPYIQIPTTLLAMVDSSVGGKTAIDLPAGKNLVGAFYQPTLVLCDPDALSTLPASVFRDGCAEVIKYGVLFDAKLFDHLYNKGLSFDREYVITRCVELKKEVVQQDEYDRGKRQLLNLGHTFGHAIEAQSDFQVSHGQAVAIGMAIISRACAACNLCSLQVSGAVCDILALFGLPYSTTYTAEQLYQSALSDKKRAGETVNLIITKQIGCCDILPTPISQVQSFIEAGL